jgi:hypothetical protein
MGLGMIGEIIEKGFFNLGEKEIKDLEIGD